MLGQEELQRLAGCTYVELVYELARKFIDETEIPAEDLQGEEYNPWDHILFSPCFTNILKDRNILYV